MVNRGRQIDKTLSRLRSCFVLFESGDRTIHEVTRRCSNTSAPLRVTSWISLSFFKMDELAVLQTSTPNRFLSLNSNRFISPLSVS
jgi:hypothetical protein